MAERGWDTGLGATPAADPAEEFCRLACLTYSREDGPARWAQARQLLAQHPDLTTGNIWAAAAAARPDNVGRLLAEQPQRVAERGGPFRWRPLYYLVYSRFDPAVSAERVLPGGTSAALRDLREGCPQDALAVQTVAGARDKPLPLAAPIMVACVSHLTYSMAAEAAGAPSVIDSSIMNLASPRSAAFSALPSRRSDEIPAGRGRPRSIAERSVARDVENRAAGSTYL